MQAFMAFVDMQIASAASENIVLVTLHKLPKGLGSDLDCTIDAL